MNKLITVTICTFIFCCCFAEFSYSIPISIEIDNFSGQENIIDFETCHDDWYEITDKEQISWHYEDIGVNFSGALFGMTGYGDNSAFPSYADGDRVIAANWMYPNNSPEGEWFKVDFDSVYSRIGFFTESHARDDITVSLGLDGVEISSMVFSSENITPIFIGIEELRGFNQMTVSIGGLLAIDDLRYEYAPSPVPEPKTITLMVFGLLGIIGLRLKRKRSLN